jgi:hypothetical protein
MWGTRLSLAVGFAAAIIAATHRRRHRHHRGLLRRAHRQRHHARRRHADGLSLHPAGAGHRRGAGARPDERADRGGGRQHPVFRPEYQGHHGRHREQGIRGRRQARGHVGREDHRDGGPAQRYPRHRHRHVDDHRLDDPGDGGAQLPRPGLAAAAGRSRLHAGRGALGADHQPAYLHRAGRDDPDHRHGDQPSGRRGARRARPPAEIRRAVPAHARDHGAAHGARPAGRRRRPAGAPRSQDPVPRQGPRLQGRGRRRPEPEARRMPRPHRRKRVGQIRHRAQRHGPCRLAARGHHRRRGLLQGRGSCRRALRGAAQPSGAPRGLYLPGPAGDAAPALYRWATS